MSKHIKLSIEDPCHENWASMTQSEQGRFCGSCQKQVVDFTNMSDMQLVAFFKKPPTGSVCGRFHEDQLDRQMAIPKKRIPWIKYFFQFALPAFLLSVKSIKASAQKGQVKVKEADVLTTPGAPILMGKPVMLLDICTIEKIMIRGKVIDENGNPVSSAGVMIRGGGLGVTTDKDGLFKIESSSLDKKAIVEVSAKGFEGKLVSINREIDLEKNLVIRLFKTVCKEVKVDSIPVIQSPGNIIMGGLRISGTAISKVEKLEPKSPEAVIKSPEEKPVMIKIYPNPVLAGTTINIGCEKLEEGYYSLLLLNQAGQQVQSRQIWIDKEARIVSLEIPKVTAGNYLLVLANNETGKKFTEKVSVQ